MGLPLSAGICFATSVGFRTLMLEFPAVLVNTLLNSPPAQSELSVLYEAVITYFHNGYSVVYLLAFVVLCATRLIIFVRGLAKFLTSTNAPDRYFSHFVLIVAPSIAATVLYAVANLDFLWMVEF